MIYSPFESLLRGSIVVAALVMFQAGPARADHSHDHGAEGEHHDEERRGPHGGRLVTSGPLTLEVTIFETGSAPRLRVYPYTGETPADPKSVQARVSLERFGGHIDEFILSPEADYLTSEETVAELHSFTVSIAARFEGVDQAFRFDSFEGRTELSERALSVAGLGIGTAGPHPIFNSVRVYGRILANDDRVAHLSPRFSGVVRELRKSLGDVVKQGETLALVESNQGLQTYEIKSSLPGTVIYRHAALGEAVAETEHLFVVADLSTVWADFQIYRDDVADIAVGQDITVDLEDGREKIPAKVTYVSPLTDEATQSRLIRTVLPNPNGALRPGSFVSGILALSSKTAPVAVERSAVQSFRDFKVIFLTDGSVFQAAPVELGRQDSRFVEVIAGVEAGARYVSEGSFLIKADIEKSGASHDH